MLKTLLCAGAASACIIGTAAAADLPARTAPPVFVPPIPVFSWTGFYLGGNAGYAWTSGDTVHTTANDPITASQFTAMTVPTSQNLHAKGVTAGGQVGYNYQLQASSFGALVIGVEADGAYTDLKSAATTLGAFNVINQYQSRLDYLGTIRGRLGVAFDRFLVYGTGGFAYGHASLSDSILPPAAAGLNGAIWAGRGGHTQTGYAVGGGVEYAIPAASFLNPFGAGAVTLRAEYLHYDLGTLNVGLAPATFGPPGTSFNDRIRTAGDLVRGGINYKFDFAAPAPVVARY